LEQYARLEVSLEDLRRRLAEVLDFDFQSTHSHTRRLTPYFELPDPPIQIEKWHLENAIRKTSLGQITKRELEDWASMLLMNEAYDWEGPDEDSIADRLNELALPSL